MPPREHAIDSPDGSRSNEGSSRNAYLGFNRERSLIVSIIVGTFGGLVGGRLIAPMFTAAAAVPGDFSVMALFFAAAVAAAFLAAGNLVYNRWGV